jgi:hypothetical protein
MGDLDWEKDYTAYLDLWWRIGQSRVSHSAIICVYTLEMCGVAEDAKHFTTKTREERL